MHNLTELDYGWSELGNTFIFRVLALPTTLSVILLTQVMQVVQILSSHKYLLNVYRPATSILKRLVEADPRFAPGPAIGSSTKKSSSTSGGDMSVFGVYRYGFNTVFTQMRREPDLLETVVGRLASAESVMALNRWVIQLVWPSSHLGGDD